MTIFTYTEYRKVYGWNSGEVMQDTKTGQEVMTDSGEIVFVLFPNKRSNNGY